jgi:hypothetical protein
VGIQCHIAQLQERQVIASSPFHAPPKSQTKVVDQQVRGSRAQGISESFATILDARKTGITHGQPRAKCWQGKGVANTIIMPITILSCMQ